MYTLYPLILHAWLIGLNSSSSTHIRHWRGHRTTSRSLLESWDASSCGLCLYLLNFIEWSMYRSSNNNTYTTTACSCWNKWWVKDASEYLLFHIYCISSTFLLRFIFCPTDSVHLNSAQTHTCKREKRQTAWKQQLVCASRWMHSCAERMPCTIIYSLFWVTLITCFHFKPSAP